MSFYSSLLLDSADSQRIMFQKNISKRTRFFCRVRENCHKTYTKAGIFNFAWFDKDGLSRTGLALLISLYQLQPGKHHLDANGFDRIYWTSSNPDRDRQFTAPIDPRSKRRMM